MALSIVHNTQVYSVNFKNAIDVSEYFAKKYLSLKQAGLIKCVDLHSDSAFSSFIKILNKEPTYIIEKDLHQIQSLLKEYEVKPKYISHFCNFKNQKTDQKITVKALDGNVYSFIITDDDSEELLRKKIRDATGISEEKQHLMVDGQIVLNVRDALKSESRRIVLVDKTPPLNLEVSFYDDNTFIEINGDEKTEKICEMAAETLGGNVDIMVPFLNGVKLDKNKTIYENGIKNGDLIDIQTE